MKLVTISLLAIGLTQAATLGTSVSFTGCDAVGSVTGTWNAELAGTCELTHPIPNYHPSIMYILSAQAAPRLLQVAGYHSSSDPPGLGGEETAWFEDMVTIEAATNEPLFLTYDVQFDGTRLVAPQARNLASLDIGSLVGQGIFNHFGDNGAFSGLVSYDDPTPVLPNQPFTFRSELTLSHAGSTGLAK